MTQGVTMMPWSQLSSRPWNDLCDMKVKSHFVSIYKPTDQEINWIVNLGLKDEQDESPFNALGLILQTRRAVVLKSDVLILHSFSAIFSFAP